MPHPDATKEIMDLMGTKAITVAASLAELQAAPGNATGLKLLRGRLLPTDGLGGTYYWDAASTEAADATYLNVVQADGVAVGRWKRIIQRVQVLPQGVLVSNAGVKTLYAAATVSGGAGQALLYLTADNTATGPALFTEIWENVSAVKPPMSTTAAEDTLACSVLSESADLRQTTHLVTRGNKTTLGATLLSIGGLVIPSTRFAPAGTAVRITVSGI